MKICLAGAALCHADSRTDRHNEANCSPLQFCEGPLKTRLVLFITMSRFINVEERY
jgi:hypothetical protein